jgi:hypothetical protein
MKASSFFGMIAVATIAASAGYFSRAMMSNENPPMMHKLKAPLMLSGGAASKHHYLLPAGTTLYYDQAFPEGFVRYKIYVNVEGTSLDVAPPTDKFWLDPLVAFPVGKEQLKKLAEDYPITKDELREILASGALSKDEIRNLLEEFSR